MAELMYEANLASYKNVESIYLKKFLQSSRIYTY